ncbi:MAG: TIGR01212 family radical SAM protein [Eubacteriaceae bacterium]|nr:TIGR01212 family radical SAM protein [Eubacteriaceae bacterium]
MYYRSFNDEMRERFGAKVYKLSLDGGFSCPNRDGTLSYGGCIFCRGGSGDFAQNAEGGLQAQIERAKAMVEKKNPSGLYMAYFQSYTNTYASPERLRELYLPVAGRDDIAALDIATRPDCLGEGVLDVLEELSGIKPLIVELGLQTVHETSAVYLRRGYPLRVYDEAVKALSERNIGTVAHMIIGIPGESTEMIVQTAEHIARSGADSIKFHMLHVLSGTDLAGEYEEGRVHLMGLEEYIDVLEECIRHIRGDMSVHRLTGDGNKKYLIAPMWSADKKKVLNRIMKRFRDDDLIQGEKYTQN